MTDPIFSNPAHPRVPLSPPQRWAAVGAVFFALLFLSIGIWRAYHPDGPGLPPVPTLPAPIEVAPKLAGCQIVGDSVAVGLVKTEAFKGKCLESVSAGVPAWGVVGMIEPIRGLYIISVGTNQPGDARTPTAMAAIRKKITNTGSKVVWVLPMNPTARAAAAAIASSLGDVTVTFTPGKDRMHPADYEQLAKAILATVTLP